MPLLSIRIENWHAWAPGLETLHDWKEWAEGKREIGYSGTPELDFLPAARRRRLSSLSKMALYVAFKSCRNLKITSVFCSRYGEFPRTMRLLNEIALGQPVSPAAFSLSVHNATSGMYSIISENVLPTSAVAACEDTFETAFVDAAAPILAKRLEKTLLVVADESLPAPYSQQAQNDKSYAAAFVLSAGREGSRISLSSVKRSGKTYCSEQHGLSFLRFFLNEDSSLDIPGNRQNWIWSKN